MDTSSKKGRAMVCRIVISFAAVAMGISCIATDASATCKFKAKKDIIVILDVGHTDKNSGQISARGEKEFAAALRRTCQHRFSFHADDCDVGLEYTRKPATTIEACQ
jgi:N-acetylmuramoyl-L-alanine amidase